MRSVRLFGRKADIVMRATLLRLAPNIYYGQWPQKFDWQINGRLSVH